MTFWPPLTAVDDILVAANDISLPNDVCIFPLWSLLMAVDDIPPLCPPPPAANDLWLPLMAANDILSRQWLLVTFGPLTMAANDILVYAHGCILVP